ncbi:hypothetical protein GW796_10835 [archaeon]|nr:hypothetical protein [archaeon]NCQ52355.1 hypothetical protein [archaeon]
MKKIKDTELINIENECKALYNFNAEKWEGISFEKIKEIIEYSFHAGIQAGQYWINELDFTDFFQDWDMSRKNPDSCNIKEDKDLYLKYIISYDSIHNIGYSLFSGSTSYKKIIMKDWDYSKICNRVSKEVLTLIPDSNKFKPKGWNELKKDYSDFDRFDEYAKEHSKHDRIIFNGVNSSSAGAGGFHERISLPNVMYDDICQRRNPLRVITSSAFSHGLFVSSHNNTVNIINEMQELKKELFKPENFKQMIYIENIPSIAKNKILQAIFITNEEKLKKYYVGIEKEYHDQDSLEKHILSKVKQLKNMKPLS